MAIVVNNLRSGAKFTQAIPPLNPKQNDVWYDISAKLYKVYNSGEWELIFNKTASGSPGGNYGYILGGYSGDHISTIDRMQFPFDSGTTIQVGYISSNRNAFYCCNSTNYAYTVGGDVGTTGVYVSIIDRIEFPFDSGTATNVGTISHNASRATACNSSNIGYAMGGRIALTSDISGIDELIFPFDSGNATATSNLGRSTSGASGCNSSTFGYAMGGHHHIDVNSSIYLSAISRLSFPFDSAVASNDTRLSSKRFCSASCNSSTFGYAMGGREDSNFLSTIDKIEFPFDSGTATSVGNLTALYGNGYENGCNSTIHGYSLGLNSSSSIDRIEFPFDSGTAVNVGCLSGLKRYGGGTDGTDFSSMFV